MSPGRAHEHTLGVGDEFNTFLDGWLEFGDGFRELFLLEGVEFAHAEVLFDAVLAEQDRGGEPFAFGDVGLDVRALNNAFNAVLGVDQGKHKLCTSLGHGEGGTAGTGLGLDDFGAAVLDAGGEGCDLHGQGSHRDGSATVPEAGGVGAAIARQYEQCAGQQPVRVCVLVRAIIVLSMAQCTP